MESEENSEHSNNILLHALAAVILEMTIAGRGKVRLEDDETRLRIRAERETVLLRWNLIMWLMVDVRVSKGERTERGKVGAKKAGEGLRVYCTSIIDTCLL